MMLLKMNKPKKLNKKVKATLKDMGPVAEVYDPEDSTDSHVDVVPYDISAYAFLEEYKKDLDVKRILKTLDIPKKTYNKWLQEPKFTAVLKEIHKAYQNAVLLDNRTVAGWSVEILQDLHNKFKEGDVKVASALSNMAGNLLRASGNFKEEVAPSTSFEININLEPSQNIKTVDAQDKSTNGININLSNNEYE